jgi:hypothetical protein
MHILQLTEYIIQGYRFNALLYLCPCLTRQLVIILYYVVTYIVVLAYGVHRAQLSFFLLLLRSIQQGSWM